ncbi:hypothetical protein O53_957 [Microcystis aeruginosa TAIHU98]|uniref:Uncharacterized protein n=1 Tax=Microcystis aeruginosa TAIHU98 TaxID=1134457 RepID=L7ECD6_MICAE|nr:hypothetical protein O53_957 [Microcystis aeruginosa TAIHU98]MDB9386113.1 hypothetical protein [Microcystis aeruginosa CS-583]ODV38812.1 hypothetical protein BFG60_1730 [Microcystis aeruginosa NIES-98]
MLVLENNSLFINVDQGDFLDQHFVNKIFYRKFGLKPRPFRTALSYNGKSDNQAKN